MFYYEEMSILGRWSPRTSPDRPDSKTAAGNRIKIRNVREVEPALQSFDLDDLQHFYNEDGGVGL